jgi:hypothetical protein
VPAAPSVTRIRYCFPYSQSLPPGVNLDEESASGLRELVRKK